MILSPALANQIFLAMLRVLLLILSTFYATVQIRRSAPIFIFSGRPAVRRAHCFVLKITLFSVLFLDSNFQGC